MVLWRQYWILRLSNGDSVLEVMVLVRCQDDQLAVTTDNSGSGRMHDMDGDQNLQVGLFFEFFLEVNC